MSIIGLKAQRREWGLNPRTNFSAYSLSRGAPLPLGYLSERLRETTLIPQPKKIKMNEVNTLLVIKVKAKQGIAPCFRKLKNNKK